MTTGPLAAQEPPGAWFLNAAGTSDDPVFFSVGGSTETPPADTREVMLGWSWDEAARTTRRYPGPVPARYRSSRLAGKQPRQWIDDSYHAGVPALGVGPGRELLLLGDDEHSTARAMRWAEMLDSVEAAYRHSSPDLAAGSRLGVIEVGSLGHCTIRSVPVSGERDGWSTLDLTDNARPSRHGGAYHVDPFGGSPARATRGTVGVQRFMRLLDGPADCGGNGLELSMIPAPREEDFYPPYFLVWSNLELQPLDFLDLEPTPRTPAVRTRVRHAATAREEINIARWPQASARGIDLCQAPFMKTLCLKDQRIREQLATAATSDSEIADSLVTGCRQFFDRLGTVPSPHPCSDPSVWRQTVGSYRTGYLGEMVLREQPRLASRTNAAGEVQWLWSDTRAPDRPSDAPTRPAIHLADGTQVAIGMPRTTPPRFRPADLTTQPSATTPPASTTLRRPPPTPATTPAVAPVPPPEATHEPGSGSTTEPDPSPATTAAARPADVARPESTPPPGVNADPRLAPETTRRWPETSDPVPPAAGTTVVANPTPDVTPETEPRAAPETPPETTAEESPPDASTEPTAGQPTEATAEPTEPTDTSSPSDADTSPIAALSENRLAPAALLALAMMAGVAWMLRGQKTSVQARREALFAGLVADDPEESAGPDHEPHELLLDDDAQGELLLAGRDLGDDSATAGELMLETIPRDDPAPDADAPIAEIAPEAQQEAPDSPVPQAEPSTEPDVEPAPVTDAPPVVLPLEPPELSAAPDAEEPSPATGNAESRWPVLDREWQALEACKRREINRSLIAISQLGEWLGCLLPVLDDIEQALGDLPDLDHLPPAARREWHDCHQAIRDFADIDLVALHHFWQELHPTGSARRPAADDNEAEAQYLSSAGLLDPEHGSLVERLRRHLLRPDAGRLQELVFSLQYLIEAFPVEHLEKSERQAYLGAVRERLQAKGLSTRFHRWIDELASGLGLRYLQARFYKARIDDPGNELLGDRHDTVDLSERLGYPAGTDDRVVVRLSELFLVDANSGAPYSGQALIDGGG